MLNLCTPEQATQAAENVRRLRKQEAIDVIQTLPRHDPIYKALEVMNTHIMDAVASGLNSVDFERVRGPGAVEAVDLLRSIGYSITHSYNQTKVWWPL